MHKMRVVSVTQDFDTGIPVLSAEAFAFQAPSRQFTRLVLPDQA